MYMQLYKNTKMPLENQPVAIHILIYFIATSAFFHCLFFQFKIY